MKLAVLFSGGKDSTYAAWITKKEGHELVCLISIFSENKESYMFHTPAIELTKKQAELMSLPIIIKKTKGKKELELKDLEEAIKEAKEKYNTQGIITGAIESVYQSSRIQKICDKLKIKCLNPLWKKNSEEYWKEMLDQGFKIIIVGVFAEGLGKELLGKEINLNMLNELKKLSKKYNFHLGFEGGEAETFVIDCPLFKKKIEILDAKTIWNGNSGIYEIKKLKQI